MAVRITQSGKVDKRSKEYKDFVNALIKARRAAQKSKAKPIIRKSKAKANRRADGHLDQRTKAGREAAARMAAARKARGSLKNKLKRLFR